jgi:hypothetical protein
MRRKSDPSEPPLGKSTRVSGILFDSFLATWSLLVREFYALGVSWGYGRIREGRRSALIAVHIPIHAVTGKVESALIPMSGYATAHPYMLLAQAGITYVVNQTTHAIGSTRPMARYQSQASLSQEAWR